MTTLSVHLWDITDSVIKPLKVPSFDMHAYAQKYGTPKRVFHDYPNDLFPDAFQGIHLTAAGNALLADGLMTTIRDLEWISPR
jgi:lysophospholipase L1-like esterase